MTKPIASWVRPYAWTLVGFLLLVALTGCAALSRARASSGFLQNLNSYCGQAFAGTIHENVPLDANDPFEGKRIIMHVVRCEPDAVDIALHVGEDRSRTWQLRRVKAGIQLKHRHRHEDGTLDVLTNYGGDSDTLHRKRMEFPADAESKALFIRENRAVSVPNRWSIELQSAQLSYELVRPGRLFKLRFDLTAPQAAPPPAWGEP